MESTTIHMGVSAPHIFSEGEGQTDGDLNNKSPLPNGFPLENRRHIWVVDFLESLYG